MSIIIRNNLLTGRVSATATIQTIKTFINSQGICNRNNTNNHDFYLTGRVSATATIQTIETFNRQGICNSNNTNNQDFC